MSGVAKEYKLVVGDNNPSAVAEWEREINKQYRAGWEFVATIQMPAQDDDTIYHAVWLFRKKKPIIAEADEQEAQADKGEGGQ